MKYLVILSATVFMFSCQKGSDSNQVYDSGNAGPGAQQQGSPARKTLKFQEILEQDIAAKETMNWGSAESFPLTDESKKDQVKLSYFFQENKLIKSKDIEKSKGYCELSTEANANANGSEIALLGSEKLFRWGDYRSEKTQINNLNYQYNAMFKLSFQSTDRQQLQLSCYNILDLTELKSTIDSKFNFIKREEKKEEK